MDIYLIISFSQCQCLVRWTLFSLQWWTHFICLSQIGYEEQHYQVSIFPDVNGQYHHKPYSHRGLNSHPRLFKKKNQQAHNSLLNGHAWKLTSFTKALILVLWKQRFKLVDNCLNLHRNVLIIFSAYEPQTKGTQSLQCDPSFWRLCIYVVPSEEATFFLFGLTRLLFFF